MDVGNLCRLDFSSGGSRRNRRGFSVNATASGPRRIRMPLVAGAVAAVALALPLSACVPIEDEGSVDGEAVCTDLAAEVAGADMSAPVVDRWLADESGIQGVTAELCPDVASELEGLVTARFQSLEAEGERKAAEAKAEAERVAAEADAEARAEADRQSANQQQEGNSPSTNRREPFGSCSEARKAGAAPLDKGDPGYSESLDRDGDGVACEG